MSVTSTWLEDCLESAPNLSQPAWLKAFRKQQNEKFLQRGLPTRKEENWKYTNVDHLKQTNFRFALAEEARSNQLEHSMESSILLVFKNSHFSHEMSDLRLLPLNVILSPLSEAIISHEELLKPYLMEEWDGKKHPFTYLNSAFIGEGVFIDIPAQCVVPYPIHLVFLNTQNDNGISCPRNIMVIREHADVKIIEEHRGLESQQYFTNVVTELHVHANARLDYYKLQKEHHAATHIANVRIRQKQDSHVNTLFIDCGSKLAREDLTIHFDESHAQCHMKGLYLLEQDGQHIDNHIHVDHLAPYCTSAMQYKGVLDKKSQAVFNGKVYAHSGAKQTSAQQSNHNLLLSPHAEVNTKPELEIYEDDVRCTHGATVGQLNEDALFYLQSRGIGKEEALTILTHAFIEEVLQGIVDSSIRKYIHQRVRDDANA